MSDTERLNLDKEEELKGNVICRVFTMMLLKIQVF
jgi:hypothetical protein